MKIERMTEIEAPFIKVDDRIRVNHYTATCQEITPKGVLFLMDQYLDKAFPMNGDDTNKGDLLRIPFAGRFLRSQ